MNMVCHGQWFEFIEITKFSQSRNWCEFSFNQSQSDVKQSEVIDD